MDSTLERLTVFVRGRDTRVACAAAVLLAEMAPQDPAVARALAEALPKAEGVLRPFVIEALGRIGTPQAAEALVPLIAAGGPPADEALRAVAHAGAGALKPLIRLLGPAPRELLAKLAEAIARTGEAQGFAALLERLQGAGDFAPARALREGMHNALGALHEKSRDALLRQLLKALETKKFCAAEPALVMALELTGDLRDPDALKILMEHALKPSTPRVRRAALLAVGRLELTPPQRGKLGARLLPFLSEADFDYAVEPAIAALREAELGAEHRSALQKLMGLSRPEVREFAMQKLAAAGGSRTLKDLFALLEDGDPRVREDAAQALAKAPQAAGPLAERLRDTRNGEASRLAARVLTARASEIPPRMADELAKAYVALAVGKEKQTGAPDEASRLEAETRRAALLQVCRATGSTALAEAALKEARKLRVDGDPQRALGLLRNLGGLPGWSDEHRLEQALSGLAPGAHDLTRGMRNHDPHLRVFQQVFGGGRFKPKALARDILRDKALSRKTVYYLGHHFAEGMGEEREFAREVLEGLAATRGDEGRQAREKLVLEGLAEKKGAKNSGILEERAKVLMAAADLAAETAADEAKLERQRQLKAQREAEKAREADKKRRQSLQRATRAADKESDAARAAKKKARKKAAKR